MIITRISSGMGNQMFMYAAGLAAALRLNTELVLDTSSFDALPPHTSSRADRPYQLSCFPYITERKASFRDVRRLSPGLAVVNAINSKPVKKYHLCRRIVQKAITLLDLAPADYYYIVNLPKDAPFPYPYKFSRICIENSAHKDKFKYIPDNTYLTGYWESEDYFTDYAEAVRRKFRFPPECFDPSLSERVRACNSVAVHVRRGDKVREDDSQASNLHYLRHALAKIMSLTENPEFFVFSDDVEWCRKHLCKAHEAEYHFVDGLTVAQDMALMSICNHVIMGPSTFSWWGAWLNENPHKIVLAPDRKINLSWYPRGAILID